MKGTINRSMRFKCALWISCILPIAAARAGDYERQAAQILEDTNIKGGLVVHLGCGDGRLTAALQANDRYIVHGLDTDEEVVARARDYVKSLGLYGEVSVNEFDGRNLPYIDNLVNLIVVEDNCPVPEKELDRVLCPNGIACIRKGKGWTRRVKPRPAEIDEWTHYLPARPTTCSGSPGRSTSEPTSTSTAFRLSFPPTGEFST